MNKTKKLNVTYQLKSFHPYYLNRFISIIQYKLGLNTSFKLNVISLPRRYERVTILISPHVDKKARDQYERTTHKRALIITILMSTSNGRIEQEYLHNVLQTSNTGISIVARNNIFS